MDADAEDDVSVFVRARWPSLVRSAIFLGAGPVEAEDLAQTALIRCIDAWPKLSTARDPEAYAFQVLVNCYRKTRVRRWRDEVPSASEHLEDEVSSVDVEQEAIKRESLRRVLMQLPVEQRTIIVLRYYVDLSERQVATILKIPVGTVKSRSSRALGKLEELLTESDGPLNIRSQS